MTKPIPFGKYYLLDRIAAGGMAEVFRAKAFGVEGFERVVAVKRILPTIAADTDFITMFIDEAKIAVQLNHANIAQIFDLGKVDDSYFIALEYVHGLDVRSIFDGMAQRGARVPVALAAYVAMKICEGLDYAHNRRDPSGRPLELVHRDVSPQNMLISFDGDVKLIDFGIAKAAGKEGRTRAGILKGKFGYLSPEQVLNNQVDARSDIFGVGIVLHELLTGRRLFVGDSEFSTIEKVRAAEVSPPHYLNAAVDDELSRIVMTALAREPDDRYQGAAALQEDLQRFLREQDEPFARRELSSFMRRNFPEHAADDQEAVGDLRGVHVPKADANDVTPIVQQAESKAVIDDTREIPTEGSSKHSSTLLGMPVVARTAPGRSVPPPPPRGGGDGSATRPGTSRARTVPPPSQPPPLPRSQPPVSSQPPPLPPRTQPPAPRTQPPAARTQPPAPRTQPPAPRTQPPRARGSRPPKPPSYAPEPASYAPEPASYPPQPASYPPEPASYPPTSDELDYGPDVGQPTPVHHYAQSLGANPAPVASIPSVAGPSSAPPASRSLPPPPSQSSDSYGSVSAAAAYRPGSVPPAVTSQNPVLDMDWDDEELSTQIYDRPDEQVEQAAAYAASGYADYPPVDYTKQGGYVRVPTQQGFPAVDYRQQPDPSQPNPAEYASQYGSPYGQPGAGAVPTFVPPPAGEASYGAYASLPGAASQGRALQGTEQMLAHVPEKSRSAFYAMAVAALLFVSFLAYLFIAKTEPGVVQLTTQPADATVLFDGKPVGTSSPFLVTGVPPGDRHVLEVKKSGYRSWSQEVQVQAGQTLQFPVTLEPTGKAGSNVADNRATGGQTGSFTLESSPPGAKVFLDDKEQVGGVTPVRIGNLVPKTYSLRLQLPDHRPHTFTVDVQPGQEQALTRVVLQPLRVRVRIVSEPGGAEVSVVRGAERRALGRSPVDVTLENDGVPWAVEVSRPGYETFAQTIALDSGERDVTVRANLTRLSGGGVATGSPDPNRPRVVREPRIEPSARVEPQLQPQPRPEPLPRAEPRSEPVAATGGGTGTLRINSRPWSQVVIDGRPIGSTPQMNVALAEGTHKVTLINPEFDIKKTLTVKIRAGQVETQIVTLQ